MLVFQYIFKCNCLLFYVLDAVPTCALYARWSHKIHLNWSYRWLTADNEVSGNWTYIPKKTIVSVLNHWESLQPWCPIFMFVIIHNNLKYVDSVYIGFFGPSLILNLLYLIMWCFYRCSDSRSPCHIQAITSNGTVPYPLPLTFFLSVFWDVSWVLKRLTTDVQSSTEHSTVIYCWYLYHLEVSSLTASLTKAQKPS